MRNSQVKQQLKTSSLSNHSPSDMKKFILLLLVITPIYNSYSQNFKAVEGSIKNLTDVTDYTVAFEYSDNLQVPNFGSEKNYLEQQVAKRELQEKGSGERFEQEWFENRTDHFEPMFIEGFNSFRLKKKKITAQQEHHDALYTISVKTHLIYPGYYLTVVLEHAKLEATISIYETANPSNILYRSEIINGEGVSGDTDRFRIGTAYEDLGRWISKFLHRKT